MYLVGVFLGAGEVDQQFGAWSAFGARPTTGKFNFNFNFNFKLGEGGGRGRSRKPQYAFPHSSPSPPI
jgi:hypothetical protein